MSRQNRSNMTINQNKIWNLQLAYPCSDICNIGGYLHLEGKYNVEQLQKAFSIFISTNSAFWTKVDEHSHIYFEEINDYHMEEYDMTGKDKEDIDRTISEWISEPFNIYDEYLFDFRLLILDNRVIIFEKFHHLIADGYSIALCAREQERIYIELENGQIEFAKDLRFMQEVMNNDEPDCINNIENNKYENYHMVSLGCNNQNISAELLSGYLTESEYDVDCIDWYEKKFNYKELYAFLRKYRISIESMIYGCLGIYFSKIQSCDGMVIGRNLLNRSKDDMSLIAMRINTLPFEVFPQWDMCITDYLALLKSELAVQSRNSSASNEVVNDKIDVEISFRPLRYLPSPVSGECIEYMNSSVEIPIKLFINDDGKSIQLQVKYQKAVYCADKIMDIMHRVICLIDQTISNPEGTVGDLKITKDSERCLVQQINSTYKWKQNKTILNSFLDNVENNRQRTAVHDSAKDYSYEEVYRMISLVTRMITEYREQDDNNIIAICLKRTVWLPVTMFAAWFSGCSFIPVSPLDSEERREYARSISCLLITEKLLEGYMNEHIQDKADILRLDNVRMDIPAYYMMTSGTTGIPKVVMISQESLCVRLDWMKDTFVDGLHAILQKTRNTFDVSIWELVMPLAYGKRMVILKDGDEASPHRIAEEIISSGITMVHFVPSMFREFIKYINRNKVQLPSLKYIILSGEALEASVVRTAKECISNAKLYNLYGPTECTIDVSYYRCSGNEKIVPIGRPVYNTELYVINKYGDIQPIGEKGELVVAGDLVGMGYFGSDVKALETGYYVGEDNKRYYKTGDLAHMGEDGMIYYDGRIDNQIKIRGMRINPDEIEAVLNMHIKDTENIIMCINDRLIDFYCGNIKEESIKEEALKLLSYYQIPSEYVNISSIPVGRHGKIDRRRLRQIYFDNQKSASEERLSEEWELRQKEEILLSIVRKILKRNDILLSTNLFDAGMDSIQVLEFVSECCDSGIDLDYERVYEHPCILSLARAVPVMGKGLIYHTDNSEKRLIIMVPFAGGTPFSCWRLAGILSSEDISMAAVNMLYYENSSVNETADSIKDSLKSKTYTEIYIIGACVGSALAHRLATVLGKAVKGIMFCESLPYTVGADSGRTMWDSIPDTALAGILQIIRGKRFSADKSLLIHFRNDVRKSAVYLRDAKSIIFDGKIVMIYGSRDPVTAGYKYRYKIWKKWLKGSYKIYTLKGAKHFLTEDNYIEISKIIRKCLV